jgi:hypothetical protein
MTLKYNKYYIGLARDGVADNFLTFRPRKDNLITEFRIPRTDDVTALIENSGLDSMANDNTWGRYRIRLTSRDLDGQRSLLLDLVRRASGTPAPIDE